MSRTTMPLRPAPRARPCRNECKTEGQPRPWRSQLHLDADLVEQPTQRPRRRGRFPSHSQPVLHLLPVAKGAVGPPPQNLPGKPVDDHLKGTSAVEVAPHPKREVHEPQPFAQQPNVDRPDA